MKIFTLLSILATMLLVSTQLLTDNQSSTANDSTFIWDAKDFQKFYMGILETPSMRDLFTLRIYTVDSTDHSIWFEYTINTFDNRSVGEGYIYPATNTIEFAGNHKGIIKSDQDGRIIFESLNNSTTGHWMIKEK